MNRSMKLAAPVIAALTIAACNGGGSPNVPASGIGSAAAHGPLAHQPEWRRKHEAHAACPQVVGRPTCHVLVVEHRGAQPLCAPSEGGLPGGCGWTPAVLQKRYRVTKYLGSGAGTIVALIEAGDDRDAATNLTTYRNEFKLGTGTMYKFNQEGQQYNYPGSCAAYDWCVETNLDIEMVSAICPECTIYVMEANSSNTSDLEAVETEAVSLGATILSNSWGCYGDWSCGDPYFANYFSTPGIAYLASSGDDSYNEIGGPAALASVISIGGTQILMNGKKYSEEIWDGAGAGCASPAVVGSPGVPKPSWQNDPDCTYRTVADVSAQAGLDPGVAEYDAFDGGWFDVGGTSVASPITAAVIALEGNATSLNAGQSFWTLSKKAAKKGINPVTIGNDGSCGREYLCTAGTNQDGNYSGPGGWGTPRGIKAY